MNNFIMTINIKQSHSGTGDNIAGNKIINPNQTEKELKKKLPWTIEVIISVIVGIATIIGVVWSIFHKSN